MFGKIKTSKTYHDDKNSNEDSNEVSEKGQGMLDIVHITHMRLLNDVLSIHNHVAHKNQKSKIQLQIREKHVKQLAKAWLII